MFNTEYRLHYGSEKHLVEKENYLNRLSFRKDRSSHEQRHTPLIWIDQEDAPIDPLPEKSAHPIAENVDVTTVTDTDDTSGGPVFVTSETPAEVNPDKENEAVLPKDVINPPNKDEEKAPKRMVLKSVNRKKTIEHEKPIIAYGWADKDSLQAKRTFNVLAPKTEVRSSALRAANLRDAQKKKRLSGREKLRREKVKQQEVIDALMDFSQWETEYRRQFSPK